MAITKNNSGVSSISVNDELLDKAIQQEILRRGFEKSLDAQIDGIYERHYKDMVKLLTSGKPYATLEKKIKREVMNAVNDSYLLVKDNLLKYVIAESETAIDDMDKILNNKIKDAFVLRYAPKSSIVNIVANKPLLDSRLLSQHFMSMAQGELFRLSNRVSSGLDKGLSTEEIADSILDSGLLKVTRIQAKTVARTAITQYGTTAAFMSYRENEDILSGYRYVATLDDRTTRICAYHDGKVYQFADPKAPRPPLHWNCRSTTVPVVKAYNKLVIDESGSVKTRRLGVADEATRATFDGQAPASLSYGDWLKKQPFDTIRSLLGSESAADLFIDGSLKIESFISPEGHIMDISEYIKASTGAARKGLNIKYSSRNISDNNGSSTGISNIVNLEDWWDGEHSKQYSDQIIQWATNQIGDKEDGRLGVMSFRGNTNADKSRNRLKYYTGKDKKYFHPLTQEYVSGSRINDFTQTKANLVRQIDEADLPDSAKYGLTNMLEKLEAQIGGPAAITVVDALRSTAIAMTRYEIENFEAYFIKSINFTGKIAPGFSNSFKTIAQALEDEAHFGAATLSRLRNQQFYSPVYGEVEINKLKKRQPEILQSVKDFRLPKGMAQGILDAIPAEELYGDAFILDTNKLEKVLTELVAKGVSDIDIMAARIGRSLSNEAFPASQEQIIQFGTRVMNQVIDQGYGHKAQYHVSGGKAWHEVFDDLGGQRADRVQQHILWDNKEILTHFQNNRKLEDLNKLPILQDEPIPVAEAGKRYYTVNGKASRIPVNTSGNPQALNEEAAASLNRAVVRSGYKLNDFANFFVRSATQQIKGDAFFVNGLQKVIISTRTNDVQVVRTLEWMLEEHPGEIFRQTFGLHPGGRRQMTSLVGPGLGELYRPIMDDAGSFFYDERILKILESRFAVLKDKTGRNTLTLRESYLNDKFEGSKYSNREVIYKLGELIDKASTAKNYKVVLSDLWGATTPTDELERLATLMFQEHIGSDGKEAMQLGRFAQEYYKVGEFTKSKGIPFANKKKLLQFESSIRLELDVAESGQANIAMQTANPDAMLQTNVIPNGKIDRIRNQVARSKVGELNEKTGLNLRDKDWAKLSKDGITTGAYNSENGQRSNRLRLSIEELIGDQTLRAGLREKIAKAKTPEQAAQYQKELDNLVDINILSYRDKNEALKKLNKLYKDLSGSAETFDDAKQVLALIRYIKNEFEAMEQADLNMTFSSAYFDDDNIRLINQLTRQGEFNNKPLISGKKLRQGSQILQDEIDRLTPGSKLFFKWHEDLAERSLKFTGKSTIDIQTLDGLERRLDYTGLEVITTDVEGGRVVAMQKKQGTVDLSAAKQAFGVIMNFASDSYVERRLIQEANLANIDLSVIYDGFHLRLDQHDWLKRKLFQINREVVEGDGPRKNLDYMFRTKQISKEDYDDLAQRWDEITKNRQKALKELDDKYKVWGIDGYYGAD